MRISGKPLVMQRPGLGPRPAETLTYEHPLGVAWTPTDDGRNSA